MLSLIDLTKSFGGVVALNDLTIEVQQGSITGLIGPNGSGKTTLYRTIMGVYKPDRGQILFKGRNITGLPPEKINKLGISMTNQIPCPFYDLTVLQNVLVAGVWNSRCTNVEEEARRAIEVVGLSGKENLYPTELTLLDLKRLELARALVSNPDLLLVDEVAAGSTEVELTEFKSIIKRLNQLGVTIILTEHILDFVVDVVDKLILIHYGKKLLEGKPDEVMSSRVIVETYLGE